MKKVRYALGAVGVAPALGLMMPNTGLVTPHHSTPAKAVPKTVSLRHSGLTSGCTASTEASKGTAYMKLWFWHTYYPAYGDSCIGTVKNKVYGSWNAQSYDRIRIWSPNGGKHIQYQAFKTHTYAFSPTFSYSVHRTFYVPAEVCAAVVSPLSAVTLGPVCKSVG